MTLTAWIWLAIGCGGCGVVGWLVGDDHGRERTNAEWVARAETEHRATWPKDFA